MVARKRQYDGNNNPPYKKSRQFVPQVGGGYARTTPTAEFKYKDTAYRAVDFPTGRIFGNGTHGKGLLEIPAGTGENDRVGRYINVHKLFFKFILKKMEHDLASHAAVTARIIFWVDKQTNGTPITGLEEVFVEYDPDEDPLTELYNPLMFRNLSNVDRFRILYDQTFDIMDHVSRPNTEEKDFGRVHKYVEGVINFKKPLKIEYKGTEGTEGELKSNSINYAIVYDEKTVVMNFDSIIRIKYTDY